MKAVILGGVGAMGIQATPEIIASRRFDRSARLGMDKQDIPIWMGVRGPKMLSMAGELADGVVLIAKSDLGPALDLVDEASGGRDIERVYLTGLPTPLKCWQKPASATCTLLWTRPTGC